MNPPGVAALAVLIGWSWGCFSGTDAVDVTAVSGAVEAEVAAPGGFTWETVELTDREVLTAFYHVMGGSNWRRSDNWLTDAPLWEWYGVGWGFDQNAVTGVDLGNNGVAGELTPLLARLDELRFLALPGNPDVTGRVPRELMDLPYLNRVLLPHTVCLPDDPTLREWAARVVEGVFPCPDGRARLPRVILREDGNGVSLRLPEGHGASTPTVSGPGVVEVSVTTDESGVWLDLAPVGIGDAEIVTDTLSARVTVRAAVGTFGVDLVMGQPHPLNAERVLTEVVEWWERMLDGSDMPDQPVETCVLRDTTGASMVRARVSDFLLVTRYRPGFTGNPAAVGGPCDSEGNTTAGRPPATGGVEPYDALVNRAVFRHEMGHALGLAGLIARSHPELLAVDNGARYFTGALATQEYRRAGGDPEVPGVPLDGPHWPVPDLIVGHRVPCLPPDRQPNAVSMYALMDIGYIVHESKIVPLEGTTVADHCGG